VPEIACLSLTCGQNKYDFAEITYFCLHVNVRISRNSVLKFRSRKGIILICGQAIISSLPALVRGFSRRTLVMSMRGQQLLGH
jgi:hypothetical protein